MAADSLPTRPQAYSGTDQRLSTMATHDETEDGEIEPAELDERAEEVEDGEFLTFEEFAGKRE